MLAEHDLAYLLPSTRTVSDVYCPRGFETSLLSPPLVVPAGRFGEQLSLDEEAGLGDGGVAGASTTAEGALSTASHDVSVMPTVVENRQGVVAPAAEPAPSEMAESKMADGEGGGARVS